MADTVVVVSGAGPLGAAAVRVVPEGAPVVAADAGADRARAAGLSPSLVVGDFDSIETDPTGARFERHPHDKDATDLELALDAALTFEPRRLLVLSGPGERLDHLAGELALLASPRFAAVEVDAWFGDTAAWVVWTERRLMGKTGELVSLIPFHGPAVGVTTDGLAYPLRGETLQAGSSRGISNVFAAPEARISLEGGVLLAIRPAVSG
jgi:thiamine pyrophosphokinase